MESKDLSLLGRHFTWSPIPESPPTLTVSRGRPLATGTAGDKGGAGLDADENNCVVYCVILCADFLCFWGVFFPIIYNF